MLRQAGETDCRCEQAPFLRRSPKLSYLFVSQAVCLGCVNCWAEKTALNLELKWGMGSRDGLGGWTAHLGATLPFLRILVSCFLAFTRHVPGIVAPYMIQLPLLLSLQDIEDTGLKLDNQNLSGDRGI